MGRYGPEVKDFDFSAERVTASVHESLARLQVPYLDVVQLHDVEFGDLDQVVNEAVPALLKIKEAGLARHIGVTGLPFKALRYVADRSPPGTFDMVLSYCHYCLNDQTLGDEVAYFQSRGMGVVNASPLCMGLLTPQGPPEWHPAPPALQAAARSAAELCASRGVDLPKLAMSWAMRNEDIATTLVGMCEPEQVRVNVQNTLEALGAAPNAQAAAEAAVLAELEGVFAPVMGLTWPSGRPENN